MSDMRHDRWEQQIGPLLDGELTTAEAALMRGHLETCPACRARHDQLALLSRSIRSLPRDPMPGDLKAAILSVGARDRQSERRPVWARPWALASLASAAIVLVVAVATMQRQGPLPPAQPVSGQISHEADAQREHSPAAVSEESGRADAWRRKDSPPSTPPLIARQESGKTDRPAEPSARLSDDEKKKPEMMLPKISATESSTGIQSDVPAPVVARYTTLLVLNDGQDPTLAPIVGEGAPSRARSLTAASAPGDSGTPAPLAKSAPHSEAAGGAASTESIDDMLPSDKRESDPRASALRAQALRALAQRRGPPSSLTYLVSIAPDGRIVSAQQIGARTESVEVIDAVRDLLQGGQVARQAGLTARTMSAMIEVRLPSASAE